MDSDSTLASHDLSRLQLPFCAHSKSRGQSIEQFFMNLLQLDWDRDRETLCLQSNDDPSRGTEKLAHLSAAEYVECGYLTPGRVFGIL